MQSNYTKTVTKILEQYIQLNGVPNVIRTDQATAFTGLYYTIEKIIRPGTEGFAIHATRWVGKILV